MAIYISISIWECEKCETPGGYLWKVRVVIYEKFSSAAQAYCSVEPEPKAQLKAQSKSSGPAQLSWTLIWLFQMITISILYASQNVKMYFKM